jgi:hypothetical protein
MIASARLRLARRLLFRMVHELLDLAVRLRPVAALVERY